MTTMSGRRVAHLSILYAEDFDVPTPEIPAFEGPSPAADDTEASVGLASIDAIECARKEGFDAGWLAASEAAHTSRETAVETMVGTLLAGVEDTYAALDQTVDTLSAEVISLVVGVLSAALPNLMASHGPGEIEAATEVLIREIDPRYRLEVELHPTAHASLAPRLSGLGERLTWRINTSMAASDLRVSWQQGSFVRDSDLVLARILSDLAGISAHRETTSGDGS